MGLDYRSLFRCPSEAPDWPFIIMAVVNVVWQFMTGGNEEVSLVIGGVSRYHLDRLRPPIHIQSMDAVIDLGKEHEHFGFY